jgi:hypothetical protein
VIVNPSLDCHVLFEWPLICLKNKQIRTSLQTDISQIVPFLKLLFFLFIFQIHPAGLQGSSVRTMTVEEGTVLNIDGANSKTANRYKLFKVHSNLSLRPPPNNDHLSITITMLESRFPHLESKETSEQRPPVNNGHYFGSQGWSLYTGLIVLSNSVITKSTRPRIFCSL